MKYWWLSFVDNGRPEGERFLGACIVAGYDAMDAIRQSHLLGVNPGGEVACCQAPDSMLRDWDVNRLFSKAELNARDEFSEYDRRRMN